MTHNGIFTIVPSGVDDGHAELKLKGLADSGHIDAV
jgi:hypothetical protein